RVGVDRVLSGVRREQDVGLIKALALGDDVAAVEPLQHDAREYEMRGRRSDVDPHREHAQFVFFAEGTPGVGEENAAALNVLAHARALAYSSFRGAAQRRTRNPYSRRMGLWIPGSSLRSVPE